MAQPASIQATTGSASGAGALCASERLRHLIAGTRQACGNPVTGREFRSRMRGAHSYQILAGYTLTVAGFVLVAYWLLVDSGTAPGQSANKLAADLGLAGPSAPSSRPLPHPARPGAGR